MQDKPHYTKAVMMNHKKAHDHPRHLASVRPAAVVVALFLLSTGLLLSGCTRANLRRVIDHLVSPDKEKPEIYYEHQGYSPGAQRSNKEEDFTRYHYYIAPAMTDEPDVSYSEPEIVFRQDYEPIDTFPTFDEEQYWRDHPLQLE